MGKITKRDLESNFQSDLAYSAKLDVGMTGNGIANDATNLNLWITSIGSTKVDLYLPSGTYLISTNVAIPSNINLIFAHGAIVKISNGVSITGTDTKIDAGQYQIFDLSLGGTIIGTWDIRESYIEWFGVLGSGDDTDVLQNAINFIITTGTSVYLSDRDYVITDTLLFDYGIGTAFTLTNGFKFIGQSVNKTRILVKTSGKSAIKLFNINNGSFAHGISLSHFTVMPYSEDYYLLNDGIELVNCIGNVCRYVNINYCRDALLLTTNNDTGEGATNTGYTEQNVFNHMVLGGSLNSITFRAGANDSWRSSFHGNVFDDVFIAVNGDDAIDTRYVGLNIESGYIYNCTFNLKVNIRGLDSHLIYINGTSGTNCGNISYEITGAIDPKISTGDNALAAFFMYGNIYGIGGDGLNGSDIDWSDYTPVTVGELDYDNSQTPIDGSNARLGLEKFYCLNVIPAKQIAALNLYNTTKLLPFINDKFDFWGGETNYFSRYKNVGGTTENGFVMACREATGAGSRFVIGTIPETARNLSDFVPGFEFRSTGLYINSKLVNSKLTFKSNGISTDKSVVNIATKATPGSQTSTGTIGDVSWDENYIHVYTAANAWKRAQLSNWDYSPDFSGIQAQAIIDGNFQIAQVQPTVGTIVSNPATNTYPIFDMWKTSYNADSGTFPTLLYSQQLLTSGSINNSKYFYRISPNGAGTSLGNSSYHTTKTFIENGVQNLCFSGGKLTLSFYARSSIANKKLGFALVQNYGTGGSPSATEYITGSYVTLTSSWVKYNFTFSVNSLSSKTFGTNNDDMLWLVFYNQYGSTIATRVGDTVSESFVGSGNIDICECSLNAGSAALTFSPKSFADELLACNRYYVKSCPYSEVPLTISPSSTAFYDVARTTAVLYNSRYFFPKAMRVAPTVTLYAYSNGGSNLIYDYTAGSTKRAIGADITEKAFMTYSDTIALSVGNTYYVKYVADARP